MSSSVWYMCQDYFFLLSSFLLLSLYIMVSAKGKATANTSKSKTKSSSSPAIVQSMAAPSTPIDVYEDIEDEFAQPLTTEASIEESVAVSENNGKREESSKDLAMESERKVEEMISEGQIDGVEHEQSNVEKEDVNLMNIDGPLDARGFNKEKDEKKVVGSGGDQVNSMVDEMIKEYINDMPCEEEVPSTTGTIEELKKRETIIACEASAGMPSLVSQSEMEEENGTLKCINVTEGEAEETDQAQVGDTCEISRNKKVNQPKKILKKKVIQEHKLALDDEQSKSGESRVVYEANAEVSMMVSDMKEENVALSCTNVAGETKGTAKVQGDSSTKKKVKKPQKIIKNKVVVQKNKLVPENAAGAQRPNVKKSEDESRGSMNSNVKQERKVEAKNVNEVDKGKKVIKKKVQAPAVKSVTKDDQEQKRSVKDNATEEQPVDAKENKEVQSEGRQRRSWKRNRSGVVNAEGIDSSVKDNDKAETSNKKSEIKVKNMGMIFMCSSKTKKDCYHYRVMGLPAGKKDIVSKVFKGMRLFLFDFDLRLLYGIYKAAGPGSYNIEPRAFNSNFPSQVRFTLLEDCLPLPEEKFRKVIKDNYYTKNKFNCELSAGQVKNLCELFRSGSKGKGKGKGKEIKPLQESRRERAAPPVSSSRKRDRSRKRALEVPRRDHVDLDRGYNRRIRDNDYERWEEDNTRHYGHDRHHPLPYDRREDFAPAALPQLAQHLPQPLTQAPTRGLAYVYGSSSQPDVYLQDVAYEYGRPLAVDLYRHEQRLPSLEGRRLREEPEIRDPYDAYRESRGYRESIYHPAGASRDYYDYPRTTEYLTQVGRSSVYPNSDSMYRRY